MFAERIAKHDKYFSTQEAKNKFCRQDSLTELHVAVIDNSEADVHNSIKAGIPIDLVDHCGRTALYYACEKGLHKLVDILLSYEARHDILDTSERSPLWVAAKNGYEQIVLALLKHAANPNQEANDRTTALYQASYYGHLQCVYHLVRFNALTQLSKNSGASPLFVAARNGHVRIVKHLLKHGANPFQIQADWRSPLHTALLYGRIRCVRLLLACDRSKWIPQSDIYGWTNLHFLAKSGNLKTARLLFHYLGPDFNPAYLEQVDWFGNTPLHVAAFRNKKSFVRFLLEKRFDADRPNFFQWTPRMIELENERNKLNCNESSSTVYLAELLKSHRISYVCEEEEMRQEVEAYVRLLLVQLKQLDPLFGNDLICSGSYYEQTRVGTPNEFDYMVNLTGIQQLIHFVDDANDPSGYGRLYPLSTEEAREKLEIYLEPITQCVSSSKIRSHFYHLLTSARPLVIREETVKRFKHLKFEWTSDDKRCGTAIRAEWYGSKYPYLTIKIDVVPCLTVYQWPRSAKIACPLSKAEFQIIARSPKPDQSYLWRISTSRTELVDFLALVDEIKNAYLILKILRDINPYSCRINDATYKSDELLTSYMLKTEFLHEISRFPGRNQWINGGLIHRVTSILKRLHRHIQHGYVPSFYIENYNVLDGDDHSRLRLFEIKYVGILLEQVRERVRTMTPRLKRSRTFAAGERTDRCLLVRLRAQTNYT